MQSALGKQKPTHLTVTAEVCRPAFPSILKHDQPPAVELVAILLEVAGGTLGVGDGRSVGHTALNDGIVPRGWAELLPSHQPRVLLSQQERPSGHVISPNSAALGPAGNQLLRATCRTAYPAGFEPSGALRSLVTKVPGPLASRYL